MNINLKKFNKEDFGKLMLPEKIFKFKLKNKLQKVYEKSYFDNLNYLIITNLFASSIILSIVCFFLIYEYIYRFFNDMFYNPITKFIIIFITFTLTLFIIYYSILLFYFFRHESKFKKHEKEIENDLPDFLDNLVSNVKGGISIEKALIKSVTKNQKALLQEVTLINQKIIMGKTIYQALDEFRNRFDSHIIQRTFFLIDEGIKYGGNIAAPLERVSNNLKKIYNIDSEIKANAGGFTTIIKAITLFVAPLLFALAVTLLTFISSLFVLLIESGTDQISITKIPNEYIDYIFIFSYSMIVLVTFFSSLITSELKNEKLYESIKYLPIYIAIGIIIFKILSEVLLTFFSNIL